MGKFKAGDIVYHKATGKKGVISVVSGSDRLTITWEDGKKDFSTEAELYTEQEFKDSKPDEGPRTVRYTDT